MTRCDVLIVGGGIAGVSLVARLGRSVNAILLERESLLATHTTGRSAAFFSEVYGNDAVREWTRESRAFFETPPDGFSSAPLITKREALYVARPGDIASLEALLAENPMELREVSAAEAAARVPILETELFSEFCEEARSFDIDVGVLFEGFRRMAKAVGTTIVTNAEVLALERKGSLWCARTNAGEFSAPILVNAAGAWAGKTGRMAGVDDRGLVPMRRTVVLIDPPPDIDVAPWPFVNDMGDAFYFKPEGGLILASPVDETPSEPCDAQPEEIDVATIAARIEEFTTLSVRRIRRSWAGLRTFTPDRTPYFGFDGRENGFFWLAGQGGYGIQTAPEISRRASLLIQEAL